MTEPRIMVCELMIDACLGVKYSADDYMDGLGIMKGTDEYEVIKKAFTKELAKLRKAYIHKREANKAITSGKIKMIQNERE